MRLLSLVSIDGTNEGYAEVHACMSIFSVKCGTIKT